MSKEFTRREFIKGSITLGGGLVLFGGNTLRPEPTRAQEPEEQVKLVEPRHNYDKIRLYAPKASLTQEELVEYSQAHKRVREWYKKLFISSDQYQNQKLNALVDQFMADIDNALEQAPPLSDFEKAIHSYLSKSRMEELGQTIPDQGFTSPFYLSIGASGKTEDALIYSINVREPVLPGIDPRFDYNDPEKTKFSILAFAYSMDLMLQYHARASDLVQSGSYNRDVFLADFKDPKKAIFLFAQSLKKTLEIFKEINPDNTPVFNSLLSQRRKLEQTYPPQEIEFEWRKLIWRVFVDKDNIPVDELK